MLSIPEELQRIWHSMVHKWNRKRQRLGRGARRWWDALILTAANAEQAAGYEMEIARRKEIGMIDPETQVIIVPDRAGQRIGSGGATLWALKQYAETAIQTGKKPGGKRAPRKTEDLFLKRRILMLHCGGEGRRVPSNAGAGKMFATLPFEIIPGRSASAFDALYVLLCACAEQMDEGMVVCSSDVLAVLDSSMLHWRKGGCCGIGIPVPLELASRHGVYVADATGKRVADYLQKLSPEELRAAGAVYGEGRGERGEGRQETENRGQGLGVGGQETGEGGETRNSELGTRKLDRALVDGAGFRFSPDLCARLAAVIGIRTEGRALVSRKGLIEDRRRGGEGIDLFTDITWPLVPAITRENYFKDLSPARAFIRERLWEQLRGADFWLDVIDTSLFIHLGNIWQILQAFESAGGLAQPGTSGDAAAIFGACDVLASFVGAGLTLDASAHVQNSFLEGARGSVGPHSLVAECQLSGRLGIGARSLLRGIQTSHDLEVGDAVILFAIPIKANRKGKVGRGVDGVDRVDRVDAADRKNSGTRKAEADGVMAYCIHGLEDNPKKTLDDGLMFMGVPMREWLERHGISEKELWPEAGAEKSLWTARLFPVGDESALPLVLWMAELGTRNAERGTPKARWRKAERVSFAEIFARIDYKAGFEQREQLAWKSLLANIRRDLRERRDPREYLESLGAAREFIELRDHLKQWIEEEANPITASRMLAFEADLLKHSGFSKALKRTEGEHKGPGLGVRGQGSGVRKQEAGDRRQDETGATRNSELGTRNYTSAIRDLSEPARRAMSVAAADASLRKVAEAVEMGISRTNALNLDAVRCEKVVIDSPARIDFGGGWTDTAPQCLERGGVILNAAVLLNGKYPIRVVGEKIAERALRLESAKTRSMEFLRTAQDLPRYQRLNDPFALLKAGLSAVGFCSENDPQTPPLEERLAQWGHGLRFHTESNIPKGSGLGTSSALGAAVIACLRRLFVETGERREETGNRGQGSGVRGQEESGAGLQGQLGTRNSELGTESGQLGTRNSEPGTQSAERETIFRQVMYLEQLLTSAGGWQDQLGVLEPGIKLATVPADPKFVLRPRVEPLDLDPVFLEEINQRLVLFYVGKRRVAFNMLREIVVGYLSGNPDVVHALEAIHDLAFEMREALRRRDLDLFGAQMTRVRMLYRLMCAGTTSEIIEDLFAAGAPYTSGGKCVGAGGGGFIMMMARSVKDAARARERLKQFSWRGLGEFYDFAIDTRGLHQENLLTV
ncbi:MAG: hypothetical protein NTX50_25495 [Candidatus Sumerlaeota bacterium]|nr:hypothetical protein [Candidatus Sumerlaeota bacterium]